MRGSSLLAAAVLAALIAAPPARGAGRPAPDLTKDPTLYVVGYSHLDTQWRWTYPQVIREMIPATMRDNFRLLEKYPDYVFNFSGANRYRMMKEYYPAAFDTVKLWVAAGRWFPCGSSMEECDVNVPGAESIIRQVLYGNRFFRRELGRASNEFMLPDCFGFPASLPGILGHCGIKGFSTQKLSWGSAVGIPFNVGVWEGPDGTGLLSALNAGDYGGEIKQDLSADTSWLERIRADGARSGVFADYGYFGTGDEGGAPVESSVQWLEKSVAGTGPVRVVSSRADQMFLDLPHAKIDSLPRYRGDLLLTEHSAGSITSAAMMKRWNHQDELLADAAERASVLAEWLGGPAYPRERLNAAWTLVMGGQFHDILPGTSHPKAYEYSWNDELLAQNQFADVLGGAVGSISTVLDTRTQGVPVVVYNPLSIEREDVVEATLLYKSPAPRAVRVVEPDGLPGGIVVPSQVVSRTPDSLTILFLAKVPSVGLAVYDVRAVPPGGAARTPLRVTDSSLENARYRVTLDRNGDVASIFDKRSRRELLSAPMRLAFLHDKPKAWPAWNVDWTDRRKPPIGYVDGPARVRVVERGPVRVAVEVVRESNGSRFAHTIRLAAGAAGDRVEFLDRIEWRGRACDLKAVFPLAVADSEATYSWEVGTVRRGNDNPKRYEVPAHQWFDLTDSTGAYGVTVLTGAKYGSDKPDDRTLRLTLLRTPGVGSSYQDQATQDWGRHEILYGLAGHNWTWPYGHTYWQALQLDQPLRAFTTTSHAGQFRELSLLDVTMLRRDVVDPPVRVMAIKKAEDSDEVIVRLVEMAGSPAKDVQIGMGGWSILSAREVDGQERPIGPATVVSGQLVTDLAAYQLRSFALTLEAVQVRAPGTSSVTVPLPFDRRVTSGDGQKSPGGFDSAGRCLPAEELPREIPYRRIRFRLAPVGSAPNAEACQGQTVKLPDGHYNRLYLLAAADGDRRVRFSIDGRPTEVTVQDWGGFIGQWDARLWSGTVAERAFEWPNEFLGLRPAYLKTAPVAWFCSHRHDAAGKNEPYQYCYLYAIALDLPPGARTLTLPIAEDVRVLAATVAEEPGADCRPARPLHDDLARGDVSAVPKIVPVGGRFDDLTPVSVERPLFGGDAAMRVTLDGTDPTPASAPYAGPYALYAPATIRARLFAGNEPVGAEATARLEVNDVTPPRVVDAVSVTGIPEAIVRFSEPLDPASAGNAANYAVSGAKVTSAALGADGRTVTLALSQPPAEGATLTVRGVRDRAPRANAVRGESRPISCLRPLVTAAPVSLDGAGGGAKDVPLGADAPISAAKPWTINAWLRIDQQPGDYTLLAGFGNARDRSGVQRYLARFPEGLHFWGSSVDVPTGVPLDLDRWQMLTATFDGDSIRVFKDGRLLASAGVTLGDAAPVARLGPPAPWSFGHQLTGRIADFTLWGAALPPTSVASLYRLDPRAAR